jgi:hypothetical protein
MVLRDAFGEGIGRGFRLFTLFVVRASQPSCAIRIQMTLHIILHVADQAASTFTPHHER